MKKFNKIVSFLAIIAVVAILGAVGLINVNNTPAYAAQATVIYDANGGNGAIEPSVGETGVELNLSDGILFNRAGYEIIGWAEDPLSSIIDYNLGGLYTPQSETTTLYAVWEIQQFTLTFVERAGVETIFTADYGASIDFPIVSKDYYDFAGWFYDDNTFLNQFTDEYMPAENLTLYAKFTPCIYNITYVLGDGETNSINNPSTYTYGTGVADFYPASKPYYTFVGWFIEENGSGSKISALGEGEHGDITLYAHFVLREFTITYDYNGGVGDPHSDRGYYGQFDYLFNGNGVTKEDMTLVGWIDVDSVTLYNLSEKFYYYQDRDITLTAVWKYVITYHSNNEIVDYPFNSVGYTSRKYYNRTGYLINGYNYGEDATVIDRYYAASSYGAGFYNHGYELIGWSYDSGKDNNNTMLSNNNISVQSNINLYAVWRPYSYSINYYYEYLTEYGSYIDGYYEEEEYIPYSKPTQYTIEDTVILPTANELSRTGYEFKGWLENNGIPISVINEGTYRTIYIYAQWQIVPYTIAYHENGGIEIPDQSYYITSTLSLNSTITRIGYTFEGWYDNAEFNGLKVSSISQGTHGDKEYWAKWINNSYQINYSGGEGSGFEAVYITYGNLNASTNDEDKLEVVLHDGTGFSKLGYHIIGWQVDSINGTGYTLYFSIEGISQTYYYDDILQKSNPLNNISLTAIWAQNTYTMTFVTLDGTGNATGTLLYDDTEEVDLKSYGQSFYRKGYTLIGWEKPGGVKMYFEVLGEEQRYEWDNVINSLAPNHITLTAVWQINTYTIEFDEDGGFPVSDRIRNYSEIIGVLPQPTKNGYVFVQWRRMIDDSFLSYDIETEYLFTDIYYNDIDIDNPNINIVLVAKYKKILTVEFSDYNLTYNGLEQTIKANGIGMLGDATVNIVLSYGDGTIVKDAGNYTAIASLEDEDYILVNTFSQNFSILPKDITVNFYDYDNLEYNGTEQEIKADAVGVIIGDTVNVSLSYNGTVLNAGSYTAFATINENNYVLTGEQIQNFTVKKKLITVTGKGTYTKVYDGTINADIDFSYIQLNGVIGEDEVNFAFTFSTYNDANVVNATKITVSDLSIQNSNYELLTTIFDIEATIIPLVITVIPDSGLTKEYGESDPVLTYTNTELIGNDFFGGFLSREEGSSKGYYEIEQGSLTLSSNYTIDFKSGVFFEILPKNIIITADENQNKEYGDKNPFYTYSHSGLVAGDSFSGVLSREEGEDKGFYAITIGSLNISDNYSVTFISNDFEILPLEITVTVIENQTKGYGTADPGELLFNYEPELIGDDNFTGKLERVSGEDVGSYRINQGTLALSDNYTIIFVSADFAITLNQITVIAGNNFTKVYDGTRDAELNSDNYIIQGILSGDVVNLVYTATLNSKNVADANLITVTNLSVDNPNYELLTVFFNIPATVMQREITVEGKGTITKEYDGNASVSVTSDNLQFNNLIMGDVLNYSHTSALFNDVNVLYAHTVTVSGLSINNDNYILVTESFQIDASITKRVITVTPHQDQMKVYSDNDDEIAYSYSGELIGSAYFAGELSREEGEDAGDYDITIGTLIIDDNYTINLEDEVFTIVPIWIEIHPSGDFSKVYDGNISADIEGYYVFTNTKGDEGVILEGDIVTLTSYDAIFNSPDVLTAFEIEVINIVISNNNYRLTNNSMLMSASITPKTVYVTAEEQGKVYGDDDEILTYVHDGLISGGFSGELTREEGEDVGFYIISQGTLSLNSNYCIDFTGYAFEITPRPITVTFTDYENLVYNGEIQGINAYAVGIVNLDSVEVTVSYEDGVTVLNADDYMAYASINNLNYSLIGQDYFVFTINKKPLSITGNGSAIKVYDGLALADIDESHYIISGLIEGDTVNPLEDYLALYDNKNAGKDKIVTVYPTMHFLNYYLEENCFYVDGEITPKDLAIENWIEVVSKVYDGTTNAEIANNIHYRFVGIVEDDSVNLSYTAQFDDSRVNYASKVTVYNLAIDNLNYRLISDEFEIAGSAITKRNLELTANIFTKEYNGNYDALITEEHFNYVGKLETDIISIEYSISLESKDVAFANNKVVLENILIDDSNYYLLTTRLEIPATITAKAITVIQKNPFTKVYDGNAIALISNNNYQFVGVVEDDSVDLIEDSYKALLEYVNVDDATVVVVTEMAIDNSNYKLTNTRMEITAIITPKEVTVTVNHNQNKTYGDSDPVLAYSVTGLVGGDSFQNSLERETGEEVGTYQITIGTLSLSNYSNYNVIFIGEEFTINRKTVYVTVTPNQKKVYGAPDPERFIFNDIILPFDDEFTGSLVRADGESAGSYAITQGTLSLNDNYVINFTQNNFIIEPKVITVNANPKTKVYGDGEPSYDYTNTPLVGDDSFIGSLERVLGEDVGTYSINIGTLALNENYTLNYIGALLSITPKLVIVTVNANQNKVYGDEEPLLTYSATDLVGDDTFSGTLEREAGEDVGNYIINKGSLSLSDNYSITFYSGIFKISPKPITVAPHALTKIYGQADTGNYTFDYVGNLVGDDTFSGELAREGGENAGYYLMLINTLDLGDNYLLFIEETYFEILPKPLTIRANNDEKTYGEQDPQFHYTIIEGELLNDDVLTGSLSRQAGEDVGTYSITIDGLINDNYVIELQPATLSIKPKSIIVIADFMTKEYGTSDPVFTHKVIGEPLPYGDTLTGALSRTEGEDAGVYTILQGALDSVNNPNYIIAFTENSFVITNRKVYVRANDISKVYGEQDPVFTFEATGLMYNDTLEVFEGSLERILGEDVGEYDILIGTLTANNYDIIFTKGLFSIEPRKYSVIYNSNGGGGYIDSDSDIQGGEIVLNRGNGFFKEGYAIIGWALSQDGEIAYRLGDTFTVEENQDTTLYAVWTICSFNVEYYKNSDDATGTISTVTTQYNETIALNDGKGFVRHDYTLIGWNTSPNGNGTAYEKGQNFVLPANNTKLYAVWQINKCELNYILESGEIPTASYDYYSTVTLSDGDNITKTGYTLAGWSLIANSTVVQYELSGSIIMPNKEVVKVYPVWQLNSYTLSYDLKGGTGSISSSYASYKSSVELSDGKGINKEGYTLTGWLYNNTVYALGDNIVMPYNNVTVQAIWKRVIVYIIDDEVLDLDTYDDGDSATLKQYEQHREGYMFGGWSLDGNTSISDSQILMDDNKTVYALWLPINFDIQYVLNDGKLSENYVNKYNIEQNVILPIPVREGYTFKGWYNNEAFDGKSISQIQEGKYGRHHIIR